MGNYIASGFGDSCDGEYVDQLDNTFELDATHWLAVDGNGNWALATNSTPGFADDYYVSTATSVDAPDSGTWSVVSGTGPVGTVTAVVPDTTAPTYDSATGASTNTAGTSVNVPLTEADSQPILPATGVTGYTVKVNTTDYVITTGTGATVTNTLLVPAQIYEGDTVKVKYDSGTGNVTDSSSNAMASFGWKDVTNNSTVTRTLYKPAVMLSSGRLGNLPADQQLIQPKPVPLQTLTDAATIAWDVSDAPISKAVVTLGGNRTLDVQNAVNGSQGVLFVKQDGTGSRTLTLPSNSKVSGNGSGVVTLSADASAINAIAFIYDGVDFYWNQAPGVYS